MRLWVKTRRKSDRHASIPASRIRAHAICEPSQNFISRRSSQKKGGLCPPTHLWDIAFPERNATSRQAVQLSKHRYSAFQAERQGPDELLIVTNNTSHRGNKGRTTRLYAIVTIKTSILFLNDLRLDVRTACERNPTKDMPTTNTNKSQAKMLSTPVNSLMRRRDMLVSGRSALRRVVA